MSFDNFDSFDWTSMQNNAIGTAKKSFEKDTRYWNISSNEQGVGSAVIRLLPDVNNIPTVQRYEYALRKPVPGGKPKWYIANSRETIKQPDPVKEHYDRLKAEGTAEADKIAKEQFSRATKYICNILVVNDPANPENNGKVFLFKMGTKLKGKIDGWQNPDANEISCGVEPKQFFNPLAEGRDILLKVKPQGGIPNYDDTEYKDKRPLFNDKATAVQWILTNCYDLQENVLSEKEFESYDELKKRFTSYLGNTTPAVVQPVAAVQPAQGVAYVNPNLAVESVVQPAVITQPNIIQPAYVQPELVAQPAVMVQPIAQVIQPTVQPATQPMMQPTTQPVVQPIMQPAVQPAQVGVASDDWMNEIE